MNRYYDELYHHGIKGQKWGVRRYQNEDGSLTPEGMKRYGVDANGKMSEKGMGKRLRDATKTALKDWKQEKGRTYQSSLDVEMWEKNDPAGYQKVLDEFKANVRNLYGGNRNVSDNEFELAIARADRDQKLTEGIISTTLADIPLAVAGGVYGLGSLGKSDSDVGKVAGVGITAVTSILAAGDTAAKVSRAAEAQKALNAARKKMNGTSEYV